MRTQIRRVAIIGTGVIGAGWAARCLVQGLDVVAWDPAPNAQSRLRACIEAAWEALERRGLAPGAGFHRMSFVASLEQAVVNADFIQESAPERESLKQELLGRIDDAADPEVIIASSTSGLLPSSLQSNMRNPQRLIVGHPLNPVYLLPLVEVVGGKLTAADAITGAMRFYQSIGMRPLQVRSEIEGFVADRLMEALWREALWLVNDDVATTEEIDAAVVYGCGLRWALMGTFLTFHLAGGEGGMGHMLHQFGPSLKLPWTRLVAPELTPDLIERIVAGCEQQAGDRSIQALERRRDAFLGDLLKLAQQYWPEAEGLTGRI